MRGAESSKRFMSYEIYFELEYYYLRSNCNGWAQSAHNNNPVYRDRDRDRDFGALGRRIALLVFVFTLSKIKFGISVYYMSEYLQTKF